MISEKMTKVLNNQINAELYSSYLYLSMSAYFAGKNYSGMASWMRLQADEEYQHAMKFFDYVLEVGSKVNLGTIEKPEINWESPLAVFDAAHKHELHVTKLINDLADIALSERDHATNIFLQWFITEQIEEVSTVEEIIQKFKLIGDNNAGLYMLDMELGKRTATPEG